MLFITYIVYLLGGGSENILKPCIKLFLVIPRTKDLMSFLSNFLSSLKYLVLPVTEDMDQANKYLTNPNFSQQVDVVEILVLKYNCTT